MTIQVVLIILFLCASAFFSGMETAIFSLSRFRVRTLLFENKKGARQLEAIKKEPGKTLASLLLSNLLVNIGASSVAAIILVQVVNRHHLNTVLSFIIEFVLMTSILLIWGEITPKVLAFSRAELLALRFSGVIKVITRVFTPVLWFSESLIRRLAAERPKNIITESEIRFMLNEAKQSSLLDESEERIGYQILTFGKRKVSEIMTPRTRVIGIGIDDQASDALRLVRKTRHSRVVVHDNRGDVCGVLYAKDLLGRSSLESLPVSQLAREPYYVPETKSLDSVLLEFRKKGVHFAVVVDEFGDYMGIVTLEDILETLFGEIVDEYDSAADIPYQKVASDVYQFDGDISVSEVNQVFKTRAFGETGERLAALILRTLGRFPREDDTVIFDDYECTVSEIHNRTIRKVVVRKR
ncbi:MAG TPA: hemolysin family protein [bacterium]